MSDLESAIAHAIELGEQVWPEADQHRVSLERGKTRWMACLLCDTHNADDTGPIEVMADWRGTALEAVNALIGWLDDQLSIRRCG